MPAKRNARVWIEDGELRWLRRWGDGEVIQVRITGMSGDQPDGTVQYQVQEVGAGGQAYPASSRELLRERPAEQTPTADQFAARARRGLRR